MKLSAGRGAARRHSDSAASHPRPGPAGAGPTPGSGSVATQARYSSNSVAELGFAAAESPDTGTDVRVKVTAWQCGAWPGPQRPGRTGPGTTACHGELERTQACLAVTRRNASGTVTIMIMMPVRDSESPTRSQMSVRDSPSPSHTVGGRHGPDPGLTHPGPEAGRLGGHGTTMSRYRLLVLVTHSRCRVTALRSRPRGKLASAPASDSDHDDDRPSQYRTAGPDRTAGVPTYQPVP